MSRGGKERDREDLKDRLAALGSTRSGRGKRRPGIGPVVLGLVLVAGVIGVIYVIYTSSVQEDTSPEGPVRVRVEEGDTLERISEKLDAAGVIESALVFELEARVRELGTQLKPGVYEFQPGVGSAEILRQLTAGKAPPTFTLTIPEGLTIEQTASEVERQSDLEAGEFEAAARRTDYGYAFLENPEIQTTEGFLFPKEYEFEKGATAREVTDRLLEQYLIETQSLDLQSAKQRLGRSEYEILTVASLVERESASAEERPLIASVIYNRLRKDMPLQIDATVQYALEQPKEVLSLQDLEVDSPYNTYENEGLPPGPICSPSLDSIQAALQPAETDYLYYVLNADGERHSFTASYDEFLQEKAEAGR